MQAYATDKLLVPEPIEARHARFFAGLSADLSARGRNVLKADLDNLAAACLRSVRSGELQTAVDALAVAWWLLEVQGPYVYWMSLAQPVIDADLPPTLRVQVQWQWASLLLRMGRVAEGHERLEDALALVTAEAPGSLNEAYVHFELGLMHSFRGQYASALTELERALTIAREQDQPILEGNILTSMMEPHRGLGQVDQARQRIVQSLELHRRMGNRKSEGITLTNLAVLEMIEGRLVDAEAHFEAGLQVHHEVGNRGSAALTLANLGTVRAAQGRREEARAAFVEARQRLEEVGNERYLPAVHTQLGELDMADGNVEDARPHLERALDKASDIDDAHAQGRVLVSFGTLELQAGDREQARRYYEAAHTLAIRTANPGLEGRVHLGFASLALEEDQPSYALDALSKAELCLGNAHDALSMVEVLALRAQALWWVGDSRGARHALARASEQALAQGAPGRTQVLARAQKLMLP